MSSGPALPFSGSTATARTTSTASASPRLGVYVHFPWCLAKCPYCDFVTYPIQRGAIDHGGYADAVITELEHRIEDLAVCSTAGRALPELGSIFFGGGTPSLWEPRELGRVLARVLAAFGKSEDRSSVEVTAECNPSSLDEDRARALIDSGVDRLSIGTQALDDGRLRLLGRLHDAHGAVRAIEGALRAGVPRVSADLIYAVGDQKPDEAAADARKLAELGLRHVSAYGLTIEAGTRFGELARRGKLPLCTDDTMVESFYAVEEALARFGLGHYEVSNYAVPGEESRHNLGYWHGDDYLGLGCAAYGTVTMHQPDGASSVIRYRNPTEPAAYIEASRANRLGLRGARTAVDPETDRPGSIMTLEPLDAETRLRERIMLGLRLAEGLDIARAARAAGVEPWPPHREKAAERLVARGRLLRHGDRLTVPRDAFIWVDDTAASLF